MSNLYTKLTEARVELQDLKLKKSGVNKYSNYQYYELGDFLPAVNALCKKHKLFTRFNIIKDRGVEKAVLTVFNSEKPEEKIAFVSPTAEVEIGKKKDGTGGAEPIQNLGGKTTYMRRYMLFTAFEMVESDMVDSINRDLTSEIPQEELDKISGAKDFAELTKVCGALKTKYKVELIQPHYEKRKEEIEDKVIKVKKEETK